MDSCSSIEMELKNQKAVLVNTKGVSMRPLLKEGKTQVLVEPLSAPLKKGDMPLVLLKKGLYRLHRVVKIQGEYIYTRGDNSYALEKVSPEQVLGIVTAIYKDGKRMSLESPSYRFYVWFVRIFTPFRLLFMKGKMLLFGIYRRMFKKKK